MLGTADRIDALDALLDEVRQHRRHGNPTPCSNPDRVRLWTSSNKSETRAAVEGCLVCPALTACAAYVKKFPEPSGVWAGRSFSERDAGPPGGNVRGPRKLVKAQRVADALSTFNDSLPEPQRTTAELRVKHPLLTASELGQLHDPPVSAVTVYNRLRRIVERVQRRGAV